MRIKGLRHTTAGAGVVGCSGGRSVVGSSGGRGVVSGGRRCGIVGGRISKGVEKSLMMRKGGRGDANVVKRHDS